ncbi:hypothetical protein EG327_003869 [Venturia inaequalis]|uniref:tRNA/rRNA methyltransferase SpoU type domain-containing protein n=1 Tax=Venturia inaequalis TaxID=5025 RepID=A0A8H3Z8Q2_VENIN|nr:hypothetical protein EG327_003869 [Venturia inaequalis]
MDLQVLLDWEEAPSSVDVTSVSSVLDLLRGAETVGSPTASLQAVPRALFTTVQRWIALRQEKPLRNALVVWTKWFSLPEKLLPTQAILCDPHLKYFDVLQDALQDCVGHPALQKYVLYVLRKSMLLLEQDVHTESFDFDVEQKLSYLAHYNKYCSLFETIVIGRSVNQAEECLHQVPMFDQRCGSGEKEGLEAEQSSGSTVGTSTQQSVPIQSLVRGPWWTILFGAGLVQANSEPIRKLLAEYVFRSYYPTAEPGRYSANSYRLFLAQSLLPYVMQGSLFTKSIQRRGKVIVSTHGEGLAQLCANLYESKETSETCGGTILKYLVGNCNTLNPHATCYILQGLDENKTWEITLEDAEFAVDLPFKSAFSQIQRVVLLRHCISIISKLRSAENNVLEDEVARRTYLQNRLAKLQSMLTEDGHLYLNTPAQPNEDNQVPETISPHWRDEQFGQWIELVDGATQQARWAEAPEQFLGPRALSSMASCASSESDFKDYVGEYAQKLFKMIQGKTFLWKPLAKALRNAYFQFPDHFPQSDNADTKSITRGSIFRGNANLFEHPQIEDVILEFINNPPLPRPEYLLDAAITYREIDDAGNHLLNVFADETTGHVCIFDMLNRLRPGHEAWGLQLLDRILKPWLHQKEPVPMVGKWKRTTQAQAINILLEKCVQELEDARSYWDKIFSILALEPHPRFRFLLEWALVSISQRVTILEKSANVGNSSLALRNFGLQMSISRLGSADHSNPKNISSLIRVAMQLALNPPLLLVPFSHEEMEADNLSLLTELIAMSASPKIPIRHEAQWCFPILFEHCQAQGQTLLTENPAFIAMNKFIRTLDKYNAPPEAKILSSFDVGKDMNLLTLFEGGYLRINPSENPLIATADFEEVWAKDTPETVAHIARPCFPLRNGKEEWSYKSHVSSPKTQSLPSRPIPVTGTTKLEASSNPIPRVPAPLQTKSLTLDSSFTTPTLDLSFDSLSSLPVNNAPNGPILIASLIEFPHNLGGLSRASEIFGCTSLYMPDMAVLKNQQFKNVSVRSEMHVKIKELQENDLASWLRNQKKEGWTVVGVEQTDTSIVIGMPGASDATMAKRSIIVMGAEKTGIPADVLVECDVCVEIKQWGVTRSLNVQSAASCVLFEWRRIWGDGR